MGNTMAFLFQSTKTTKKLHFCLKQKTTPINSKLKITLATK